MHMASWWDLKENTSKHRPPKSEQSQTAETCYSQGVNTTTCVWERLEDGQRNKKVLWGVGRESFRYDMLGSYWVGKLERSYLKVRHLI